MGRKSKSYDTGKQGEHESWRILERLGFVRPNKEDRKEIIDQFFKEKGIELKSRGFDVIKKSMLEKFRETKNASEIVLYELKTAGKNRKQEVQEDFSNLGFTLTSSEKYNAEVLGQQYKFIFLNLKTESHVECSMDDFFNDKVSNIYPTWSIFIVNGIAHKNNR